MRRVDQRHRMRYRCAGSTPHPVPKPRPFRVLSVFAWLSVAFLPMFAVPGATHAQWSTSEDPRRFLTWPLQDARDLVSEINAERIVYLAGIGGVLTVMSTQDRKITRHTTETAASESLSPVIRVVEEFGNARAVRPMAAMVLIGALMSDDPRMQDAAFTSLEAVVFANAVTNTLKAVAGRARPYQEMGPGRFEPFSGNTSFPSGHATTAFALVTPWLLYYPHHATAGLLVLTTGTALTRVATNVHWFTDVVAGSAIGFTTAYWLTQRHKQSNERILLAPMVADGRLGMSLKVDF